MADTNPGEDAIVVIGAGIIGCAVAWVLTKSGRRVLLLDRAEPATAGASFGNAGHIATEQVQPLPSRRLLTGFWRQFFAFDGPLDIPLRRVMVLAPWMGRFAVAALRQSAHTIHLEPLIRSAADAWEAQLEEIGRRDLILRNGHYALWLGAEAAARAAAERHAAARLQVATRPAPEELLEAAARAAAHPAVSARIVAPVAGLWFPDSAHVLDPALVARALVSAAVQRGAGIRHAHVRHVRPRGERIEIITDTDTMCVRTAVICAGAWSRPLLAPFGLNAPLEAERGYHIELPGHTAFINAPIAYADHSVIVTPMSGRLRASSFLEFAGLDAAPDPRKPARLRTKLRALGYRCDPDGPSWMGPRPTFPDYLPGIGRASGPHELFYAVGHQHLGLTLAAVTAELVAGLVGGRQTRLPVAAFDLQRFGRP